MLWVILISYLDTVIQAILSKPEDNYLRYLQLHTQQYKRWATWPSEVENLACSLSLCAMSPPTYLCVNTNLSLAPLVSLSVALPAEFVQTFFMLELYSLTPWDILRAFYEYSSDTHKTPPDTHVTTSKLSHLASYDKRKIKSTPVPPYSKVVFSLLEWSLTINLDCWWRDSIFVIIKTLILQSKDCNKIIWTREAANYLQI